MAKILLGADPELFLRDGSGNFISAWGLFPGTKDDPYPVEKGAVQVDGCALEFNVDPAATAEEFDNNIKTVLTQMDEMIKSVSPDIQKVFVPYAEFDPSYFETVDEEAKILGCEPDFNSKGLQNPSPDIQQQPFRTAAGHAHLSWTEYENTEADLDNDHFRNCLMVAKHFGSKFKPMTHAEFERLKYYGGDCAFRPKHYGVELRSPSNIWVQQSAARIEMFNSTMKHFNELVEE